jgi:hypothetical protein
MYHILKFSQNTFKGLSANMTKREMDVKMTLSHSKTACWPQKCKIGHPLFQLQHQPKCIERPELSDNLHHSTPTPHAQQQMKM